MKSVSVVHSTYSKKKRIRRGIGLREKKKEEKKEEEKKKEGKKREGDIRIGASKFSVDLGNKDPNDISMRSNRKVTVKN